MPGQAPLSRLKLVRIGKPISHPELAAVGARIGQAFSSFLRTIRMVDYDLPQIDKIEAEILTQALDHEVGGHILGITDADLLDRSTDDFFQFMFGCKDNRNQVAVVSTRRIGSDDSDRSIARLLKVALHEIGHNFGLEHHYAYVPASDGRYCPMTKGDYNRHGERSYTRAVIDSRGFRFCDGCLRFLRVAHPQQT